MKRMVNAWSQVLNGLIPFLSMVDFVFNYSLFKCENSASSDYCEVGKEV